MQYITDAGVQLCGSLSLVLQDDVGPEGKVVVAGGSVGRRGRSRSVAPAREIQAKMLFGDTEVKASARDVRTGQTVRAAVDFLCESNPKYRTKL